MIREGDDYALIAGQRWWPFGRSYRLNVPVEVVGYPIRKGYEWDGASFLPMWRDCRLMRGFLVHDWHYKNKLGSVWDADQAMIDAWAEDDVPVIVRLTARLVLVYFWPACEFVWRTRGVGAAHLGAVLANAAIGPALLWLVRQ